MVGDTLDVFLQLDEPELLAMMKWAKSKCLNEVLPAPFVGKVSPETNDEYYYRGHKLQVCITAVDPAGKHPKMVVWQLREESNRNLDRIQPQGMQPGMGWAYPAIAKAFKLLREMWAVAKADAKIEKHVAFAARDGKHRAAVEHYKAMLTPDS